MKPPRAVTFDFHDTIAIAPAWFALEVRELPARTLAALAATDGILPDATLAEGATAVYRTLRGEIQQHGIEQDALAGMQHTLHAVGIHRPDAEIAAIIDRLMADTRADARPRPGIVQAVRFLANLGMPMAVISNAVYHPFLVWCLDEWGLTDDFTAVISSAACGYYKSHASIYRCALDTLGVAPHETLHVGDSYRFDIEAAHRLGMRTCWLNVKGEQRPDSVADFTVPDLIGLGPLLVGME